LPSKWEGSRGAFLVRFQRLRNPRALRTAREQHRDVVAAILQHHGVDRHDPDAAAQVRGRTDERQSHRQPAAKPPSWVTRASRT
jgi:hypothetical protein